MRPDRSLDRGSRIREVPRAPNGIYRDFEQAVLEELIHHNATMHGCRVEKVESKVDGAVAIWFSGIRDGSPWRGALRFNAAFVHQRHHMVDSEMVSEAALKLLEQISLRKDQPMVIRAA